MHSTMRKPLVAMISSILSACFIGSTATASVRRPKGPDQPAWPPSKSATGPRKRLFTDVRQLWKKSVFSHLPTNVAMPAAACRCCDNRSIPSTHRAHSSKLAARCCSGRMGQTHRWTDRRRNRRTRYRFIDPCGQRQKNI